MRTRQVTYPGSLIITEGYLPTPVTSVVLTTKAVYGTNVITQVTNGDRHTPNPIEFQTYEKRACAGRYSRQTGNYVYKKQGDLIAPGTFSVTPVNASSEVYNLALTELNELVRGRLDLLVDLAEAGKTRRMLRDASKIVGLARNLRANFTGCLASKWLELQYGWKPLLGSIYGVFDEIMDKALKRKLHVVFRGRSRRVLRKVHYQDYATMQKSITTLETTHYRGEIQVVLHTDDLDSSLANYTSLNPASLTWELLPYSFVVDWFINVGDYLRNVETAFIYGALFKDGYYTYGYKSRQTHDFKGIDPSNGTWEAAGSTTLGFKKRTRLVQYPFPHVPTLTKFDLGSGRLWNAAALLRSFIGSRCDPNRDPPKPRV